MQLQAAFLWHVKYSYCDEDLKFRGSKYTVTSVDLKQVMEVRLLCTDRTW